MDYGNPDAGDEEIVATLTAILGDPHSEPSRTKTWHWVSADYQVDDESQEITHGYSVAFEDSSTLTLIIVADYPINPALLAVIGVAQWFDLDFSYIENDDLG